MAIQSLLIILVILAVLLIIGVPISYAIGISSLVCILQTVPLDVSVVTGAQRIFVGMSKFSLTAIPFFILAGNLMNQGGIAKRLVDFVMAILGKLPGALLVTNVGAPSTLLWPPLKATPRNRTPMNFCPSCAPCMKLMAAAPNICAPLKKRLVLRRSISRQIRVTSLQTTHPEIHPRARLSTSPYRTFFHSSILMPPIPL